MTDRAGESHAISGAQNRRFKDKISKQWVMFCGDCAPAMKYLASKSYRSSWAPVKFLDALFRGYGQVVFANNPISGILIFIGLTVADPAVSAAGLLTACVGLLVSIAVIPQSEDVIINGLTVFNPLLIGLITTALLPAQYGIELEYWHYFFMIIAAAICVYVTSAFGNILSSISRYPLPYLTVPFNVVQQLLFLFLLTVSPVRVQVDPSAVQTHPTNPEVIHMTSQSALPESSSLVTFPKLRLIPELTSEFNNWSHIGGSNATDLTQEYNFSDKSEDFSSTVTSSPNNELFHLQRKTIPPDAMYKNGETGTEVNSLDSDRFDETTEEFPFTSEENKKLQNIFDEIMNEKSDNETNIETSTTEDHSTTQQTTIDEGTSSTLNDVDVDNSERIHVAKRSVTNEENEIFDFLVPTMNSKINATEPVTVDWGGIFSGIVLSMAQVYGSSYAPTSILIYLAVMIYSPITAGFAFLGAFVSTITGVYLLDPESYASIGGIYDGTWGFNGVLSTMCLGGLFFVLTWPSAIAALLCAVFSTVLFSVLLPPFANGDLHPLSLPFNLSALLFLCVTSTGSLVRPKAISFPEKQRQEYRILRRTRTAQEQVCSSVDAFEKETEMEKKPSLAEVV